ncbi:hypothetical protein Halru_2410 [Halovivax ruber XH-70]|uniref:Uncharacterized protein n=1 Tax=Halovivax ruber (strain DSM 18193 / JCM 13892 / XH-70) TaxID=797302 RepID=L0IDT4_HALRX|nr:hypothetical protein [Halovivax ruber]AGB16993.1 hypothetical protein Halru_2410 [Halovivax ruber XH-70]
MIFPSEAPLDAKRKKAGDVDGVQIKERKDGSWIVKVDRSEAEKPDPAPLEETQRAVRNSEEAQIKQELQTQTITPASTDVPVGTQSYIWHMTRGDESSSSSGHIVEFGGQDYDTSAEEATAATLGTVGWGAMTRSSWIGTPFRGTGSGTQSATVTAYGDYNGFMVTAGSGSFSADVEFVLQNLSTNAEWSTTIYQNSGSLLGGHVTGETNYTASVHPEIRAGDDYLAYTRLETSVNLTGGADCSSDFGPQDGDDAPKGQGVGLYYIGIDF